MGLISRVSSRTYRDKMGKSKSEYSSCVGSKLKLKAVSTDIDKRKKKKAKKKKEKQAKLGHVEEMYKESGHHRFDTELGSAKKDTENPLAATLTRNQMNMIEVHKRREVKTLLK